MEGCHGGKIKHRHILQVCSAISSAGLGDWETTVSSRKVLLLNPSSFKRRGGVVIRFGHGTTRALPELLAAQVQRNPIIKSNSTKVYRGSFTVEGGCGHGCDLHSLVLFPCKKGWQLLPLTTTTTTLYSINPTTQLYNMSGYS